MSPRKQIRLRDANAAPLIAQGVSPVLARIYAARGIQSPLDMDRALSGLLPASFLKGLPEAHALLIQALREDWRVLIVGDFDADGATSTALAILVLRALGARQVDYLVPNRFDYGYGLTPEIVAVAKAQKRPDLIITVDNGIASLDGVAAAHAAGIKVLITDHHLPGAELPAADAIVNPNQPDCAFSSKALAGVGVVFYLLSSLRSHLREQGWFAERGLTEPNMADYLDLVALGTVADVVALDRNNRLLVWQGLQRIRAGRCRPGITALLTVAKRQPGAVTAIDIGFAVGPRLNAAGRLDDMAHGIECLLAEGATVAKGLAEELDALNSERREIEAGMQQEALASLTRLSLREDGIPHGLTLYDRSWHQGVIGILAGRIKERYHRPVIAFAPAELPPPGREPALLKGSARSIPGVHIRDVLDRVATRHPGLISKFGGHAMAAGLSLPHAHLSTFEQAFDEAVREMADPHDLEAAIWSDGELGPTELRLELAQQLREAGPWGQAFPEPLFHGEFLCLNQRLLQERHLKLSLAHPDDNTVFDAIAFNVDRAQWPTSASRVRLAYRLDVNEFRGVVSLQLRVEYLEPVAAH